MPLDHLAVYLSNSCNLACSYCYVSVNQGPPVQLSFEQIKESIDAFYAKVAPPNRKITFLGGEPLLNWPVFRKAAAYARRTGGRGVVLQTFTNGTLLTPEKLAFLDETGVHVTVSLDGRKADNDKHRVYFKAAERSVFDDVMRRLEPLPKANLGVSLVFTSETIDHFLGNVDYFRRLG
ncbi:MAG TPA: radical SAM protein, partial [Elusimicrobiota bacterium]|nr:radical SAM protein [Elusimicrobiota bacterium]